MSDVRRAAPPADMWDRIDKSLDPPRPRLRVGRLLQRFAADPSAGGHVGPGLLPLMALPGATVLSLLILFAVTMQAGDLGPWAIDIDSATSEAPTSFGLTEPEFAMQPEMDQRLVSVALPPGPTERDAPPAAPPAAPRKRFPSIRAAEDALSLGPIIH